MKGNLEVATTSLTDIAAGNKPKAETPIAKAEAYLKAYQPQMALALPKHLTADRMTRLALTSLSTNTKLLECDPKSLAGAIITLSQLGLEIGVMGHAYLVPYKGRVTPIPGWRGLVDLVNRSGRATVWTGAVFEGDDFDYQLGDSPFVRHRPGDEDDPAKLTHVYACGQVKGAVKTNIEVYPIRKVWKHRDRVNKVGNAHYSYAYPEMYARKVPLLQVLKYMPSSIEMASAMELSGAQDSGGVVIDGDFKTIDQERDTPDPETGEIKGPAAPPAAGPSFAVCIERLKSTTDPQVAAIILDDARLLPEDQYKELLAFFQQKFTKAENTPAGG